MLNVLACFGILAELISAVECAYRSYGRYTRYTRYTYYSSGSGGGLITGYVFAGIAGVVLLGIAIYFLIRHCNKKKQTVTPRPMGRPPPGGWKPYPNTISGTMVQPPPYMGPAPTYNQPPGFSSAYPPPQAPMQGFNTPFTPPPPYQQTPPPVLPNQSYSQIPHPAESIPVTSAPAAQATTTVHRNVNTT